MALIPHEKLLKDVKKGSVFFNNKYYKCSS